MNTSAKMLPSFWINLAASVLLTAFLFFIDEGDYNFSWTQNTGNWILFFFYAGSMLTGLTITDEFVSERFAIRKNVLTSFIGILLGLAMLFTIGFVLTHLSGR